VGKESRPVALIGRSKGLMNGKSQEKDKGSKGVRPRPNSQDKKKVKRDITRNKKRKPVVGTTPSI